jgi:hypothetical protein
MAKPTTVQSAAGILDLSVRQVQRLVAEGELGRPRSPTAKERKTHGFAHNTQILDGDKVRQLRRARVRAGL